jgi:hypothetical protein
MSILKFAFQVTGYILLGFGSSRLYVGDFEMASICLGISIFCISMWLYCEIVDRS